MKILLLSLLTGLLVSSVASAAEQSAVVKKEKVSVYAQPNADGVKLEPLRRDAAVTVVDQQGLWYELRLPDGGKGYVRVNDVRVDYAGADNGAADLRAATTGKAGQGRITETAGVRGIEESELQSAEFNQEQLDAMMANRIEPEVAEAWAGEHGWQATSVAFANESTKGGSGDSADMDSAGGMLGSFGSLGSKVGSLLGSTQQVAPKSEEELVAEELALGPEIAGRMLGARPLWQDANAQERVNIIGRWLASQTARPELPWAFGVIDEGEVNAFAAPGGYVLVTRGLYELLSSDAELAAVLGHEIRHCVRRDHYDVIRKQQVATVGKDLAMQQVQMPSGNPAIDFARQYVEQHGATILLTALDRGAEYRADEAAEIYLARAGLNPLAYYSVLQKMTAAGRQSGRLASLTKTHPPLDARLDKIDKRGYAGLKAYTARD